MWGRAVDEPVCREVSEVCVWARGRRSGRTSVVTSTRPLVLDRVSLESPLKPSVLHGTSLTQCTLSHLLRCPAGAVRSYTLPLPRLVFCSLSLSHRRPFVQGVSPCDLRTHRCTGGSPSRSVDERDTVGPVGFLLSVRTDGDPPARGRILRPPGGLQVTGSLRRSPSTSSVERNHDVESIRRGGRLGAFPRAPA